MFLMMTSRGDSYNEQLQTESIHFDIYRFFREVCRMIVYNVINFYLTRIC